MSLHQMSLFEAVKKQFSYKMKSQISIFGSLILLQLLGLLFTQGFTGSSSSGRGSHTVYTEIYSSDVSIIFTILWVFVTGVYLTTKAVRYDDFAFISNRLSSTVANVFFLLTASVIGGVSAFLSGYLAKLYYFWDKSDIITLTGSSIVRAPLEFIIGIAAAGLYMFFFSALGYLIGMLVQWSKLFIFILPAALLTFLALMGRYGYEQFLLSIPAFLFKESSLLLFFIKIIILSFLFFAGAQMVSKKLEVRL